MDKRMHKNDRTNCFFRPANNQYIPKTTRENSSKGTNKLMIDNRGNDLGAIYGSVREAMNNKANILFIKNTILFKNDKFFKRGIVLYYFLPALKR